MNMDINLTQTTDLQVNLLGVLQETSRPGAQADLWDLVYTVPSAAFPIRDENGIWGGSDTWAGTQNPVAQSIGAAYYKNHTRSLFADMKLTQDLSGLTKGLNAFVRISYDNIANIYEDHSKEYVYSVNAPTWADGASEPTVKSEIYGRIVKWEQMRKLMNLTVYSISMWDLTISGHSATTASTAS